MDVVVTLTTIPERLSSLHPDGILACFSSLTNQTVEDYEIHFNIPYRCLLTGEEYTIPEWLQDYNKVKVFRTGDLGPATKSVPTIRRIENPETLIIVVDDDLVYDHRMVEQQILNQQKWSEAIVGYDGLRSRDENGQMSVEFGDSRDHYYSCQQKPKRVDILQHYKTVSYKRGYFEEDFFDFVADYYSWSDDLLLAAYFAFKGRDRIVETHDSLPIYESFEDWLFRGGVETFPVLRHTNHGPQEGCNLFRAKEKPDNGEILYKFIDRGYQAWQI